MSWYKNLSSTCKGFMAVIGAYFAVVSLIGLAVITGIYAFEAPGPFVLGLALACAVSIIKSILLEKTLSKCADMEHKNASAFARLHFALRYGLTIAMLVAVVLFPGVFGLFGTILGVLSLQISAYIVNHLIKRGRIRI